MRCFHRVLPLETVDGRKGLTNIVVTRAGWNRISVIRWSHLPLPTHHRLSSPFFFISGRTRCVPPLPSPLLAAFDPLPRPVGASRRNDWPPPARSSLSGLPESYAAGIWPPREERSVTCCFSPPPFSGYVRMQGKESSKRDSLRKFNKNRSTLLLSNFVVDFYFQKGR